MSVALRILIAHLALMVMSVPSRTFITERQLCEKYLLSHRTVARYLKSGLLKGYRVGPKMIRFDAEEVERALIGQR